MEDADLPKALIKRIAKAKLARLDQAAGKNPGRDIQISKDALQALSESARVFINYLTATGNDICKEARRQIISVDDVLTALEDLEFIEILPSLKDSLAGKSLERPKLLSTARQGAETTSSVSIVPCKFAWQAGVLSYDLCFIVYKADSKEKSKKKAEQLKKRKLEDQAAAQQTSAVDPLSDTKMVGLSAPVEEDAGMGQAPAGMTMQAPALQTSNTEPLALQGTAEVHHAEDSDIPEKMAE